MSNTVTATCHVCQEQLTYLEADGWKYCPSCGTQINKPRAKAPKRGERYLYEPRRTFEDDDGVEKKECRECSLVVEANREYCPRCGSRFMRDESNAFVQTVIRNAHYLGGSSHLDTPQDGSLAFAQDGVHFEGWKIDATEIKAVELGGGQVAKSKILATVMFGVYGGLAARGAKDRAEIAVHLHSGTAAFFIVDNVSPFQVRARITPALRAASIPFADELGDAHTEASEPTGTDGLVEQLERLAQLHERGFLSDEEVAAAKAKLLG